MNLPTIIVLLIVAAATALAIWLPRRSGRKITDCGCQGCQGCSLAGRCQGKS